jgi:phage FluMu protein Com
MRCGNCNRLMAISVEDLGGQVHCPHCQTIVETQPPPKKSPETSRPESGQTEFLFPGSSHSEDIFSTEDATQTIEPAPSRPTKTPAPFADATEELASLQPRRAVKSGAWSSILLIFLIPYAILATAAVVYL